ncbi:MAG: hypothetical protein JXR19_00590 [Bacteroidia bacterium]
MKTGKTMNKLMQIAMLSCKKATELTEKKTVSRLSYIDQKRLNLHIKMCKICAKYQNQSLFIDEAIGQLQNMNNNEMMKLTFNGKEKIIHSLKQKGV